MEVSETRRLRALGYENRRLKSLAADLSLNREGAGEKAMSPDKRGATVGEAGSGREVLQQRACAALGFSRASARYESKREDDDPLRRRLCELAQERRRFGYRRLAVLVRREAQVPVNTKKDRRLCRGEGLAVKHRKGGIWDKGTCRSLSQAKVLNAA